MSVVVPNAVALANIADGASIVASDHRNNYAAVQVGVNGLIAMFTVAPTKGDLIVSAGGGSFDKLGVGANGTVVTADSAQPLGVKWATPATAPLTGLITGAGAITAGTGFSVVRNGAGDYTITFTAAFATTPVCLCGVTDGSSYMATVVTISTASVRIITQSTAAGALADHPFNFIAMKVT